MYLIAALGGSALIGCGLGGFTDNYWFDLVMDILNEDLFS
jgi:hypothetical protein